jgi:probable HAF family extracellular repeat protein
MVAIYETGVEMRGRRGMRVALVVAIAMAVAPVATAVAQSSYQVVEIGTAPGFDATTGDDINASGQVAGTLHGGVSGEERSAFVWDPSTGVRVLGDFAGEGTFGGGINDRGVVTGAAVSGHVYFGQTAFRWTTAGGFENLGPAGFPSGINNAGEVIGTALGQAWVRWDAGGQVRPFGSLPYVYGSPRAINNEGQIVGWAAEGGPARLWDPRTGLGELPAFPGGFGALAYDINDLGHASGNADVPYVTKLKRGMSTPCGLRANSCAVIWRDGRPTAVGPDGSYGYGINNKDRVVGQFLDGSHAFRAFLYRDGVFSDLNQLVPAGTPFLEEARAINDAGWILANGGGRAFVLIPN